MGKTWHLQHKLILLHWSPYFSSQRMTRPFLIGLRGEGADMVPDKWFKSLQKASKKIGYKNKQCALWPALSVIAPTSILCPTSLPSKKIQPEVQGINGYSSQSSSCRNSQQVCRWRVRLTDLSHRSFSIFSTCLLAICGLVLYLGCHRETFLLFAFGLRKNNADQVKDSFKVTG